VGELVGARPGGAGEHDSAGESATKAEAGDAASSAAVPTCATRPPSITPIWSPSSAASMKSWVTSRVGTPVSRRTEASSRPAEARVRASSADSGSSSRSAAGRRASARATATRWRSPPERVRGRASANSAMPKRSSSSSARRRRSRRGTGLCEGRRYRLARESRSLEAGCRQCTKAAPRRARSLAVSDLALNQPATAAPTPLRAMPQTGLATIRALRRAGCRTRVRSCSR